jgi:hypothetical protein
MRLSKKLVAAAAIVGAVALLAPSSAYAEGVGGGAVVVTGSGTISPGLDFDIPPVPPIPPGEHQAVTFSGTATGLGLGVDLVPTAIAADVGTLNCQFAGSSSIPETPAAGAGTVQGECSGAGLSGNITVTCRFDYVREAALVQIVGTCTVTASGLPPFGGVVTADTVAAGVFVFVPTSVAPTTSYLLVGAAAGAGPTR